MLTHIITAELRALATTRIYRIVTITLIADATVTESKVKQVLHVLYPHKFAQNINIETLAPTTLAKCRNLVCQRLVADGDTYCSPRCLYEDQNQSNDSLRDDDSTAATVFAAAARTMREQRDAVNNEGIL